MARMPVVFIGHGSPMNTLESNRLSLGSLSMACYAVGCHLTELPEDNAAAPLPEGVPPDNTNT